MSEPTVSIVGYASGMSVIAGQTIGFCLSASKAGTYTFTIRNVGDDKTSANHDIAVDSRKVTTPKPWEGYGWSQSGKFQVPDSWPSGLYELLYGSTRIALFVVRSSSPGKMSKLLLHIPGLTHQAYNNTGGKSLYDYNSSEKQRASIVSFDRPTGITKWEEPFINWMKGEKQPMELCGSIDLHTGPEFLSHYDCLILAGHDEYWTKEMYDNVEKFICNGGNVIVLSGNTCYRQVRLEENGRKVICYRDAVADPCADATRVTVAFAQPPVNRPQNRLFGAGFTSAAIGTHEGSGTGAFEIHFLSHPLFAGVKFKSSGGRSYTDAFLSYETDAVPFTFEDEGYPRVTGEEGTPLSTVVLGTCDLRRWLAKPGWATMTLTYNNGRVFHAGTTEWVDRLAADDEIIVGITRNVLRQLGRRAWGWEPIGTVPYPSAMTGLGGKLYATTKDNQLWSRHPVPGDVKWKHLGHANDVKALAGDGNTLFAVTANNNLWWRSATGFDAGWTAFSTGPGEYTGQTRAMACSGGMLYAIDVQGKLYTRPASREGGKWRAVPSMDNTNNPSITALAAYNGILVAVTKDNRLLRTNQDLVDESTVWTEINTCFYAVGLGVVEGMLFLATAENRLWQLDMRGLRQSQPPTADGLQVAAYTGARPRVTMPDMVAPKVDLDA